MDSRGARLGYSANFFSQSVVSPLVGEIILDLRCDWASLQYLEIGCSACHCALSVLLLVQAQLDPSGLVQH